MDLIGFRILVGFGLIWFDFGWIWFGLGWLWLDLARILHFRLLLPGFFSILASHRLSDALGGPKIS